MSNTPEPDTIWDGLAAAGGRGMNQRVPKMTSEAELTRLGKQARRNWRIKIWAGRAVLLAVIIGGWQLCTSYPGTKDSDHLVNPFFFGKPSKIWTALVDLFQNGTAIGNIWTDIWVTAESALLGFALGLLAGVVLGVLLGSSRLLAETIGPFLKMLNAIPRIVLGSIFFIAFGTGTFPAELLAGVLVFFVVFFNAFQGVREVDQNVLANVRVLGASRWQVARHATLPSALTWIIASLHTAFGFAIVGVLVQEILGSQHGLGLVIHNAQNNFDAQTLFACIFIVMVMVLIAETGISFVERRLLSWRPPSASEGAGI